MIIRFRAQERTGGRRSLVSFAKGFTLIETVLAIAIMVILVGMIVPLGFQLLSSQREIATQEKLKNIKQAVLGNPQLTSNGKRVSFGYLGDMGSMPPDLNSLVQQGTQPAFSFNSNLGIGTGWHGPYLSGGFAADTATVDEFNTPLTYLVQQYTNSNGQVVVAKLQSAGRDRTFNTADDFSLEILQAESLSTVSGYVKSSDGQPVQNSRVTINYPQNGLLSQATVTTDSNGLYQFPNIPFGISSITVVPGFVFGPASAQTFSKGTDLTFRVTNFSPNNISITSVKAVYTSVPVAYYNQIWLDGTKVFDAGNGCLAASGSVINVAPYVVKGSADTTPPPTTVYVTSATTLVADVVISNYPAGTSLQVALDNFGNTACKNGAAVDMTGVPFTVTFSDGSSVTFAPTRGS